MSPSRRILLFLLLFGVPLIFLYPLSKGEPNTKDLPIFGKNSIKDFEFFDVDSNVVNQNTTQGKTLVVSTLVPSCPYKCPIIQKQLKFLVYDKLNDRPDFKDLLFISHLVDTNGKVPDLSRFLQDQNEINPSNWKIVVGEDNPIYDLELPAGNMKNKPCDGTISCMGGKAYYQMILLIDKNRKVRGLYQGNQTQLLKGLRQDIRKLFIEYKKEEKE